MTRSHPLFVMLFIAGGVVAPTTASADETATDLRGDILQCKPSCYEKDRNAGPAKKVKVCAYLPIHFTQEKRGRSWSKLERSSAMSPTAVPGCKFPSGAVAGKWKSVVAQAKKQLDLAKGDVVTVHADYDDWAFEKDDFGRVTARDVVIDHYSRGHEDYDRCNSGDPWAVCEPTNNEVTSFNQASYRVTEAKKLKQSGKQKDCRTAAWDAVRQAVDTRKEREQHKSSDSWKSNTYATRYDGLLSEKQMFAKNDALEAEARSLWTACGGKGEVPLN